MAVGERVSPVFVGTALGEGDGAADGELEGARVGVEVGDLEGAVGTYV